MSSFFKFFFTAVVGVFLTLDTVKAQSKLEGYEFGVNLGTLIYQGDLTLKAYGYLKEIRPAVGIYASKPIGDYFAVRVGLTHGKILADDSKYDEPEYKQNRNFRFSSPVNELAATAVFLPFGHNSENNFRRFSPYVFAGIGVSFLNII